MNKKSQIHFKSVVTTFQFITDNVDTTDETDINTAQKFGRFIGEKGGKNLQFSVTWEKRLNFAVVSKWSVHKRETKSVRNAANLKKQNGKDPLKLKLQKSNSCLQKTKQT